MELADLRALFPVTRTTVFLTLAAKAPSRKPSARTPVRQLLARLLGGRPEE